jgi:hypothetical protein
MQESRTLQLPTLKEVQAIKSQLSSPLVAKPVIRDDEVLVLIHVIQERLTS